MIKDAKVHLGKTPSDLSDKPAEVIVDGVPMTIKEASKLNDTNPEYVNQPKNLRSGR